MSHLVYFLLGLSTSIFGALIAGSVFNLTKRNAKGKVKTIEQDVGSEYKVDDEPKNEGNLISNKLCFNRLHRDILAYDNKVEEDSMLRCDDHVEDVAQSLDEVSEILIYDLVPKDKEDDEFVYEDVVILNYKDQIDEQSKSRNDKVQISSQNDKVKIDSLATIEEVDVVANEAADIASDDEVNAESGSEEDGDLYIEDQFGKVCMVVLLPSLLLSVCILATHVIPACPDEFFYDDCS